MSHITLSLYRQKTQDMSVSIKACPSKELESKLQIPRCHIYVLSCEQQFYYIAKANVEPGEDAKITVDHELNKYKASKSESWNKLHKPEVLAIYENTSPFAELSIVLEYMQLYGINKVCNDTFSNPRISEGLLDLLDGEFKRILNKCRVCAGTGHDRFGCDVKITTLDIRSKIEDMKIDLTYEVSGNKLMLIITYDGFNWDDREHIKILGFVQDNPSRIFTAKFEKDNENLKYVVVRLRGELIYLKLLYILSLIK